MNNRNEPTINMCGTKLRVRRMKPTETIQEGDLTWHAGLNGAALIPEDDFKGISFQRSTQVGEKVGEYPSWVYLRVLSKFWK